MPTIALIDDDRNILTSVSIALETKGYRISTYADGDSALDGFRTAPPDLAILDIKMPRMDGMETLRRLRQTSDVPVIFLTSSMRKWMNCSAGAAARPAGAGTTDASTARARRH